MTEEAVSPREATSPQDGTEQAATKVADEAGGHAPVPSAPTPHRPVPAGPQRASEPHPNATSREHLVPVASDDPGRWGRVDEDGTVYLRTGAGERAVGSWQAGAPAEGLAHFAMRFDDLRTEVELLHTRLNSGSGDPKHTAATARQLRDSLAEAAVVGDVHALSARLEQIIGETDEAAEVAKQAREATRADAIARKEKLISDAEQIAESSSQWKAAGDRLRAILEDWKTIRGIDRKTDDALWKRFSKAREAFNRRRGTHFAELDKQRATAKERKQELLSEAETLASSTEWAPTAARFRQLMAEWKAAGRAPKDADEALWQRFRAAQDTFFGKRSETFSERDAEFSDNAKQKEELIAEAEKIDPAADLAAARSTLHRIQERWDAIGKVPRERIKELEGRMRAAEDKVRHAADTQWRRSDPEAQARAAQFKERVEQFEAQAAKARAAGDEKRAKQFEAQAEQWREWQTAAEHAIATR